MLITYKKYLIISLLILSTVNANASCLDNLLPAFRNNTITINNTDNNYEVLDSLGKYKTVCNVGYSDLETFVNANFIICSTHRSTVSTALITASQTPVCPTISALAKLRQIKSADCLSISGKIAFVKSSALI